MLVFVFVCGGRGSYKECVKCKVGVMHMWWGVTFVLCGCLQCWGVVICCGVGNIFGVWFAVCLGLKGG